MSQNENQVGQLTLRKKQKEFVETILSNGKGSYLLNVPGGYGKTDTVLVAYKLLRERNEVNRFLYVCWGSMRKKEFAETLQQKLDRIDYKKSTKYLVTNYDSGVTLNEHNQNLYEFYLLNAELLIYNLDHVRTMTQTGRWFIVIDESHHATEENKGGMAIDQLNYEYRVGLSATPGNVSGQSLINHNNTKIDNIVSMDIAEAVKEKAIRAFNYQVANYDVELIDSDNQVKKLTTDEIREWEKETSEKMDSTKFEIQKKLRISDRYVHQIFTQALYYYNLWNQYYPDQHKIIVFAPNVITAKYACEIINSIEGKGFADWIGSGFYGRPTEENQKVKKDFSLGDLQCLVQVNMAGEGFDAPRASIGVWLSFAYNGNMALQMCYRIMRRNYNIKDYSKDNCIMLVPSDSGAIDLFQALKDAQEFDFDEVKKSNSESEESFPNVDEILLRIVEAKIKEWRGELLNEEKIKQIKNMASDKINVEDPKFENTMKQVFEQWFEQRNEKVLNEVTREEMRKIVEKQVRVMVGKIIKIIYGEHSSIKGVAGDFKNKINSKLMREFGSRDKATIDDLKKMSDFLTEQFSKMVQYNAIPSWV